MRCDRLRVSSFRDGLLSTAEASAFEAHLRGCADCRQTLADYQLVGEAIRALPRVAPPAELRRGVMTRLPDPAARPAWGSLVAGLVGVAAVATIALLAGRGLFAVGPSPAPMAGAPAPGVAETGPAPTPSPMVVVAAPATPTRAAEPAPTEAPAPPPSTPTPSPTTATPARPATSPTVGLPTVAPTVTAAPASPMPVAPTPTPPPTRTAPVPTPSVLAASPTARGAAPSQSGAATSPTPAVVSADVASRNVVRAPLVTPTPGCPRPEGRIGQAYAGDPALQAKLGCATGPQSTAAGHEATFQNGLMLRRADTRRIYALGPGGWSTFLDAEGGRSAAAIQPGEPAPPFLQAYRDQPNIRDALGRAIADPRAGQLTFQPFERGLVIVGERRGLFILYNDGRWESVPER
jgi:hypothetical protein